MAEILNIDCNSSVGPSVYHLAVNMTNVSINSGYNVYLFGIIMYTITLHLILHPIMHIAPFATNRNNNDVYRLYY